MRGFSLFKTFTTVYLMLGFCASANAVSKAQCDDRIKLRNTLILTYCDAELKSQSTAHSSTQELVYASPAAKQKCFDENEINISKKIADAFAQCDRIDDKDDHKACTTAHRELTKTARDAGKACGAAAMPGAITSCLAQVNTCNDCFHSGGQNDEEAGEADTMCAPDLVGVQSLLPASAAGGLARVKYGQCPAMAAEGLKDLRSEVNKLEKDLNEQKDDLTKLQEEIVALEKEIEDLKIDRKRELDKAKKEIEQKLEDTLEAKDAKNSSELKRIAALSSKISELERQHSDASLTRREIILNANEQMREVENACSTYANGRAESFQKAVIQNINNRTYTASSQSALFKRANVSSQTEFDRMYNRYYGQCMKRQDTLKQLNSIIMFRDLELDKLESAKAALRQQIEAAKSEQKQLKDDLSSELQKYAEKIIKLGQEQQCIHSINYEDVNVVSYSFSNISEQDCAAKNVDNSLKQAILEKMKLLENKKAELQRKSQELQKDQQYFDSKSVLMQVREEIAGDRSTELGKFGEAAALVSQVKSEASIVAYQCCPGYDGSPQNVKAACDSACDYLAKSSGDDLETADSLCEDIKSSAPNSGSGSSTTTPGS